MTTITIPTTTRPPILNRLRPDLVEPLSRGRPKRVSLETYWQVYYHDLDHTYEYNDGLLEEKPMARQIHFDIFLWFSGLIRRYLEAKPIAKTSGLEIGFELALPHKTQVRRPDLAIVLNSNSVPFEPLDMKYLGVFDVCVEAVSDSSRREVERDTNTKFHEYEAAGVPEYWLLSNNPQILGFYRLNAQGVYQPVPLTPDGVWQSQVLPGFQLRRSDLLDLPSHDELMDDPVYAGYLSPKYQAERQRAEQEYQRAEQERQRAMLAEQGVEQERQKAEALMAYLRQQGIEPESILHRIEQPTK